MLTGGEPFLRTQVLFQVLSSITAANMESEVTTNASWAATSKLEGTLERLAAVRLSRLTISVDKFHTYRVGLPVHREIVKLFARGNYPFKLRILTLEPPNSASEIIAEYRQHLGDSVEISVQPVLPVGRAAEMAACPTDGFCCEKTQYGMPCHWVLTPFIDAFRRWHLCCMSPCMPKASVLCMGELGKVNEFPEFLRRHTLDPLFRALRALGPRYIADCIEKMAGRKIPGEGCGLCLWEFPRYDELLFRLVVSCEFLDMIDFVEMTAKKQLCLEDNPTDG